MSDTDDDKNIQRLLQIRLLYFLFTIALKVEQPLNGGDHINRMHYSLSKTLFSQINFYWCSYRKEFGVK